MKDMPSTFSARLFYHPATEAYPPTIIFYEIEGLGREDVHAGLAIRMARTIPISKQKKIYKMAVQPEKNEKLIVSSARNRKIKLDVDSETDRGARKITKSSSPVPSTSNEMSSFSKSEDRWSAYIPDDLRLEHLELFEDLAVMKPPDDMTWSTPIPDNLQPEEWESLEDMPSAINFNTDTSNDSVIQNSLDIYLGLSPSRSTSQDSSYIDIEELFSSNTRILEEHW